MPVWHGVRSLITMQHYSFLRCVSATLAGLMLFQSTAPVAYAANCTTTLESSVVTSESVDESVSADSDGGYIPEIPSEDMNVSDDTDTDSAADAVHSEGNSGKVDEPDSSESTDSSLGDTQDSDTNIDPITPDEEQPPAG